MYFPSSILQYVFLILISISIHSIHVQAGVVEMEDIKFLAYTDPKNPDTPRKIKLGDEHTVKVSGLKKGNEVVILVHGYGDKIDVLNVLKEAYLKAGTLNVIIVDWTKLSTPPPIPNDGIKYYTVVQRIPSVGQKVGKFINFLMKCGIISGGEMVHMVGHSLGSHVCGSAGLTLQNDYSTTLSRISGLDPAGPLRETMGENGLNKKQASFVDVVHTDVENQGTPDEIGHVDFYSNGGVGKKQPECGGSEDEISACAHGYAIPLFARTVNPDDRLTVKPCRCSSLPKEVIPAYCRPSPFTGVGCINPVVFGEFVPREARGKYYLHVE